MEKMASTTGGMQGYLVTERDAEGRERIGLEKLQKLAARDASAFGASPDGGDCET